MLQTDAFLPLVEDVDRIAWNVHDTIVKQIRTARTELEVETLTDADDAVIDAAAIALRLMQGRKVEPKALVDVAQAIGDTVERRALPQDTTRSLRELRAHVRALVARSPETLREPEPPNRAGLYVPSALLHQIHAGIYPAEKMYIASVRNHGDDMRVAESAFDVTGKAIATHVDPDPTRLADALLAVSRSGSYFGLWAHSHPGAAPGNTYPSGEDLESYRQRRERGDSEWLVGAIFAGQYVRFWGDRCEQVVVTGRGADRCGLEEQVYELAL